MRRFFHHYAASEASAVLIDDREEGGRTGPAQTHYRRTSSWLSGHRYDPRLLPAGGATSRHSTFKGWRFSCSAASASGRRSPSSAWRPRRAAGQPGGPHSTGRLRAAAKTSARASGAPAARQDAFSWRPLASASRRRDRWLPRRRAGRLRGARLRLAVDLTLFHADRRDPEAIGQMFRHGLALQRLSTSMTSRLT